MPELGLAGPSGAGYICAKKIQSYFRRRRRLSREHTDQGCCPCLCGMADQQTRPVILCLYKAFELYSPGPRKNMVPGARYRERQLSPDR
jgi:hypothetical protein